MRSGFRSAGSGATIGELVCDRDTPFTDQERALLTSIAHHAAVALEHGRAVMRGVLAQEIHHRVKNNLQTVASLLRLQARSEGIDPQKALEDSVNRILAIAAVHEVLTERRDEVVELGDLLDRLRAMLVQGLGADKHVEARLTPVSIAGGRATALALVFSELLQNALEHGGDSVLVELAQRDGEVVLAIADDGSGNRGRRRRHGALDRSRARARRAARYARPALERRPASRGRLSRLMELDSYTFVLLKRGPRAAEYSGEELDRLQEQHLAHLAAMAEQGHLLFAGPFSSSPTSRCAASASTRRISKKRDGSRSPIRPSRPAAWPWTS